MKKDGITTRNTKIAYGNSKVTSEAKKSAGTGSGADRSPYSSAKFGANKGSNNAPYSSAKFK